MTREELEHIIRAAGTILHEDKVIVIGSQSILGTHTDGLPPVAQWSMEADILPLDDPDGHKADLIDGTIGRESSFHHLHGIYGDGVRETTSVLPRGWRDRLVPISGRNTNGITGYCLEPHDLLIAKYIAGRDKDLSFCASIVASGFVDKEVLLARMAEIKCSPATRSLVAGRIERDFSKKVVSSSPTVHGLAKNNPRAHSTHREPPPQKREHIDIRSWYDGYLRVPNGKTHLIKSDKTLCGLPVLDLSRIVLPMELADREVFCQKCREVLRGLNWQV